MSRYDVFPLENRRRHIDKRTVEVYNESGAISGAPAQNREDYDMMMFMKLRNI